VNTRHPLADAAALAWLGQPWIDGRWSSGDTASALEVVDPSTETVLGRVAQTTPDELDAAVAAAQRALSGVWGATAAAERAALLRALAEHIRAERDSLAVLEAQNNGKPLREAQWDVDDAAGCFSYYADQAEVLEAGQGRALVLPSADFQTQVHRTPVGVAAGIVPWNFPLLMAAWKVAPALAAGCTMLLKPSELTPCTALHLARLADAAGLPPGVLQVLPGDSRVGAALAAHPGVDKVAFTGSLATGRRVMQACAERLARVTLELGGKSALIVFDDVDLEAAVEWTLFGIFWNKGEVCSATSRVLVHERLADAFNEHLLAAVRRLRVGGPFETDVEVGPLVAQRQLERVQGFVDRARSAGIEPAVGGGRVSERNRGYFFAPTVYIDPPTDSEIWRDEVFGPVLCVRRFSDEAQALALANDTHYGLAGGVLSADRARGDRVARALRAGVVWIDCSQPTFTEAPWGGMRASGLGRELGPWGLDAYLETQQLTRYVAPRPWGWFKREESPR
jgi:betaine-aldehyde dehydrogenase